MAVKSVRLFLFVFVVFSVFLLLTVYLAEAEYTGPSHGALAKGEALFNTHCAKCHGTKAAGTDRGPTLIHKFYHPNHHADESFRRAVVKGVVAHHWRFGNMPKIDGVGSQETELLIKYVRHIQKQAGIY